MIGKYPPIEGGVSARVYWLAKALGERGHEVHIVTNAQEVESEYKESEFERMFLAPDKTYSCILSSLIAATGLTMGWFAIDEDLVPHTDKTKIRRIALICGAGIGLSYSIGMSFD